MSLFISVIVFNAFSTFFSDCPSHFSAKFSTLLVGTDRRSNMRSGRELEWRQKCLLGLLPCFESSTQRRNTLPYIQETFHSSVGNSELLPRTEENCAIRNLLVVIPSGYPTPSSSRLDPLVSSDLHFSSSRPICYSQHRGRPLPVPSGTILTRSWISWRRDHASSMFLAFSCLGR
jgi:hypothetical protein